MKHYLENSWGLVPSSTLGYTWLPERKHLLATGGREHQKVGDYRESEEDRCGKAEGSLMTPEGPRTPVKTRQKPGLTHGPQPGSTLRQYRRRSARDRWCGPFKLFAVGRAAAPPPAIFGRSHFLKRQETSCAGNAPPAKNENELISPVYLTHPSVRRGGPVPQGAEGHRFLKATPKNK